MIVEPLTAKILSKLTSGETLVQCKNCGLKFKNPYKRILNPLSTPPDILKPTPFWIKLYTKKSVRDAKVKIFRGAR